MPLLNVRINYRSPEYCHDTGAVLAEKQEVSTVCCVWRLPVFIEMGGFSAYLTSLQSVRW